MTILPCYQGRILEDFGISVMPTLMLGSIIFLSDIFLRSRPAGDIPCFDGRNEAQGESKG